MKSVNQERIVQTSVIVCTKDRAKTLINLLASLSNQTMKPNEVIIVDASKNDDTKILIDEISIQLPYEIFYKKALPSSARQRNIGAAISRGNYLFFFDDDVVLDSDYIRIIMDTFSKFENCQLGGITGRIVNIKQSKKKLDTLFRKVFFLSDIGDGKVKLSGFPSSRIDEKETYVGLLSGCNMVFPKAIFLQFMFDEIFDGYSYMEDVDLSYRVGKRYPLYYQPKARVNHYSTSYKEYDSKQLRKMMIQSHRYLFKKNQQQDLKHILSHWISIVGVLLYNGLILRDLRACRGIFEGLLEPLEC